MTTKRAPVKVKVPQLAVVRAPAADFDVGKLTLQGKALSAKLTQAITDGSLEQTMDGASTLTLTVSDWYHGLLRSQLLQGACTLTFDGLSFTLVKIATQGDGDAVSLTFEETAVNVLRQYSKPRKASRDVMTRAQFVRTLVAEPTQARIPFQCPEVNVKQPIGKSSS